MSESRSEASTADSPIPKVSQKEEKYTSYMDEDDGKSNEAEIDLYTQAEQQQVNALEEPNPKTRKTLWERIHFSLIHPFRLRADVNWSKQDDSFSLWKWEFTKSGKQQKEFQRYQYRSFVTALIYFQVYFSVFFYPLIFLYDDLVSGTINTIVPLCFAGLWSCVIPFDLYCHLLRKVGTRSYWAKVRAAAEMLILVTFLWSAGYTYTVLFNRYCGSIRDPLLGTFLRDEETYKLNDERSRLYCRETVPNGSPLNTMIIIAGMNISPLLVVGYVIFRILQFPLDRGLMILFDTYAPNESAAHLATKAVVVVYCGAFGLMVVMQRYKLTRSQFLQTVQLMKDLQTAIKKEEHVDLLLCSTVPSSALIRLSSGSSCRDYVENASVLFSDIAGFTAWSSRREPEEVVRMLNVTTELVDERAIQLRVEKVKTIGDAYWAVTGIPDPMESHALVLSKFAIDMHNIFHRECESHPQWGRLQLRVGIHSGALDGGILGTKMISYEVFGQTCDVASLVEQNGEPGRVVVTKATAEAAGFSRDKLHHFRSIDYAGINYELFILPSDYVRDFYENQQLGNLDELRLTDLGEEEASVTLDSKSMSSYPASASQRSKQSREEDEKVAKRRRQAFLQQRAALHAKKQEHLLDIAPESSSGTFGGDLSGFETVDAIRTKYSERKHKRFVYTFANDDAEGEFLQFTKEKLRVQKLVCQIGLILLPVLLFLFAAWESEESRSPGISLGFCICMLLSVVTALADAFLSASRWADSKRTLTLTVKLQTGLGFLSSLLMMLGAWVAEPGMSVATNDPSWIFIVCVFFNIFSNIALVPSLLLFALGWCNMLVTAVASTRVWFWTINRAVDSQSLILGTLVAVVYERQMRQQFLEAKLQEFYKQEQLKRLVEQDALLRSIVPQHITSDLLQWLSGSMKSPLVRSYSLMAVGFIKLFPKTSFDASKLRRKSTLLEHPNQVGDRLSLGQVPCDQSNVCESSTGRLEPSSQDEDDHWLPQTIKDMDNLLDSESVSGGEQDGPFGDLVSKVKTMGDVIMFAGPFPQQKENASFKAVANVFNEDNNVVASVIKLVQLCEKLNQLCGGIQAGVHAGSLVGTIQGTTRLCFDTFGDTVNTASRTMTATARHGKAPPYFTALSKTAVDLVTTAERHQLLFSGARESLEVEAKGKGTMVVFLAS